MPHEVSKGTEYVRGSLRLCLERSKKDQNAHSAPGLPDQEHEEVDQSPPAQRARANAPRTKRGQSTNAPPNSDGALKRQRKTCGTAMVHARPVPKTESRNNPPNTPSGSLGGGDQATPQSMGLACNGINRIESAMSVDHPSRSASPSGTIVVANKLSIPEDVDAIISERESLVVRLVLPRPSVLIPGLQTYPSVPNAQLDEVGEGGFSINNSTPHGLWTPIRNPSIGLLTPPGSRTRIEGTPPPSLLDPKLLEISHLMTSREPLGSKPEPQGRPMVWADSRQALCETLPYFKKPQGGCHQNDRHVYSFLYDGVGHCREYMDADVIIARAGGGMEYDAAGQMVQRKDHSMTESQVLAVMNDAKYQNPLVVICGNRNSGALTKLPHKYCVLDWYKPIMVWAEKTAGKGPKVWTTIKYRFERLNATKQAWHAPKEQASMPELNETMRTLERRYCTSCHSLHPQVYLEGWMCLTPACDRFWRLPNGHDAPCGVLRYNPAFLLDRTAWADEREPFSVKPSVPDVGKVIGDNLTYINTRGVCCPECGRCNSRYRFRGWVCDGKDCSWELTSEHKPIIPAALHSPWDSLGEGPSLARNKHEDAGVNLEISYTHNYKINRYTFDGIQGCFIHAVANVKVNQEERGPNDMLIAMQEVDIGLERRRFNSEKMSGNKPSRVDDGALERPSIAEDEEDVDPTLTKKADAEEGDFMTAFSMNYGMPYKFVARGATQPFDDAPWPVRACRSRLNWAARQLLGGSDVKTDFNELLVFAYMEGQKIEYHDDGEEGLGSRIASLSLGGKAKMHLRKKAKHFVGCSKTGILTTDRPVPGSIGGPAMYEKRLEAWKELQRITATDRALYQKRLRELPKELGLYDKRNKKADDLLQVTLGHGDMMLMEGYEIQKYLEHKVVPEGYLRFAMTCRDVLGHHLANEELPEYEVKPDDYGYDGSNLV